MKRQQFCKSEKCLGYRLHSAQGKSGISLTMVLEVHSPEILSESIYKQYVMRTIHNFFEMFSRKVDNLALKCIWKTILQKCRLSKPSS